MIDYPRYDRDRWTRWLPSWKLVTSTTALFTVAGIALVLAAYAATPVPVVATVADTTAQTTTVYYKDGSVLTKFSQQNRTIVPFSKIPPRVRWAVISAEDRTFYQNNGISPAGIIRPPQADAGPCVR